MFDRKPLCFSIASSPFHPSQHCLWSLWFSKSCLLPLFSPELNSLGVYSLSLIKYLNFVAPLESIGSRGVVWRLRYAPIQCPQRCQTFINLSNKHLNFIAFLPSLPFHTDWLTEWLGDSLMHFNIDSPLLKVIKRYFNRSSSLGSAGGFSEGFSHFDTFRWNYNRIMHNPSRIVSIFDILPIHYSHLAGVNSHVVLRSITISNRRPYTRVERWWSHPVRTVKWCTPQHGRNSGRVLLIVPQKNWFDVPFRLLTFRIATG